MAPFSAVLQAGYEQAIEQNADYTFFVNADSVMLPGAMSTMVE